MAEGIVPPPSPSTDLSFRAARLERLVRRASSVSASVNSTLASLESRLSRLEGSLLPIQAATATLSTAHTNVERAITATEEALEELETLREVELRLRKDVAPPPVLRESPQDATEEEDVMVERKAAEYARHVERLRQATAVLERGGGGGGGDAVWEEVEVARKLMEVVRVRMVSAMNAALKRCDMLARDWIREGSARRHQRRRSGRTSTADGHQEQEQLRERLDVVLEEDGRVRCVVRTMKSIAAALRCAGEPREAADSLIGVLAAARRSLYSSMHGSSEGNDEDGGASSSSRFRMMTSMDVKTASVKWTQDMRIVLAFANHEESFLRGVLTGDGDDTKADDYDSSSLFGESEEEDKSSSRGDGITSVVLVKRAFTQGYMHALKTHLGVAVSLATTNERSDAVFSVMDMLEEVQRQRRDASNREEKRDDDDADPVCVTLENTATELREAIRTRWATNIAAEVRSSDKQMPQTGGVHALTSLIMSVLRRLFDHEDILAIIVGGADAKDSATAPSFGRTGGGSREDDGDTAAAKKKAKAIAARKKAVLSTYAKLIDHLERELNKAAAVPSAGAEGHHHQALHCLFMMNNIDYIETSMRRLAGAEKILSEKGWAAKQRSTLERFKETYVRASWSVITNRLEEHDRGENLPTLKKKEAQTFKDTFRFFNTKLKETLAAQAGWVVPSVDLRTALIDEVEELVVTAYDEFCRLALARSFSKYPERHMITTSPAVRRQLRALFTQDVM